MTDIPEQTTGSVFDPPRADRVTLARDRAFLYVRDLCLPPELSLELILESLKRAAQKGWGDDIKTVMEELRNLLEEKEILPDPSRTPDVLGSTPPMNRRTMIAEPSGPSLFRRLCRAVRLKRQLS